MIKRIIKRMIDDQRERVKRYNGGGYSANSSVVKLPENAGTMVPAAPHKGEGHESSSCSVQCCFPKKINIVINLGHKDE